MKPCLGQKGVAYELKQAKEENAMYHNVNNWTHYSKKDICKNVGFFKNVFEVFLQLYTKMIKRLQPEIHLRQRQAEARCGSLSLVSVDGAPSRAACLKGCRDPSHRVSVDQSEARTRNSPPYAQYGQKHASPPRNWGTFFSLRRGVPRMLCRASACLCLKCIPDLTVAVYF